MCPLRTTNIYWVFGDAKYCKEAAHITHAASSPVPVSSFSTEKMKSYTGTELYWILTTE